MLLALVIVSPVEGQQETRARPIVSGRLIDDGSRLPVAQGAIHLLKSDHTLLSTVLTDTLGRFRIVAPGPGPYRLRAERLGYRTATSDPLHFELGDTLAVDFLVSPSAVLLSPIVVTGSARTTEARYAALGMGDFYRRMMRFERGGKGVYMTRDSLARHEGRGASTSRVLSIVPGVQSLASGNITMRDDCTPRFFLDGAPYTLLGASLDLMLPLEMLEAIEVYVGSAVPGEFFGGNCGAVVFWTRRT
jgi:hypothetical protein